MDATLDVRDYALGADTHVLEARGQIDLYTAPEFKSRLIQLIEDGKKHILVDFSNVRFMDSTALGVLVGALKRLRPAGGSIAIVTADDDVRRLFELLGLDHAFAIHPTAEEALSAGSR
jgi:anti-sigma B factor antagonist